jgi:hypothetical protein
MTSAWFWMRGDGTELREATTTVTWEISGNIKIRFATKGTMRAIMTHWHDTHVISNHRLSQSHSSYVDAEVSQQDNTFYRNLAILVLTYPLQHWTLMISGCRVVAGVGGESSCGQRRRRQLIMRELLHDRSAHARLVRLDFATLVARLPINANLDIEKAEHG